MSEELALWTTSSSIGVEQVTGNSADRYQFGASPRGRDPLPPESRDSARRYSAMRAGVDQDLAYRTGPVEPVRATLDPALRTPIKLDNDESEHLVKFVARHRPFLRFERWPAPLTAGLALP